MNLKSTITLASAVTLAVVVAHTTVADTVPMQQNGQKRRVEATVNTQTAIVSQPVVTKKVEGTENQWVPAPEESAETEFTSVMQEPYRPIIPIVTALVSLDCDNDGVLDSTEISNGAMDWDTDGVLDSCEYRIGDLNLNGVIDSQDVSILLGWWAIPNPLFGDLDFDNVVGARDLGILLGRWGVVVY
ncbi:MAG: hypothetical protein RLZZ116_685 [Planctomycetota bacterium]